MVAKKNALGRGLGALIDQGGEDARELIKMATSANEIPLKSIEANPFQPRTNFDEESLNELVVSIKELGIIQPLTVRKIDDNRFQLITGERRFRAAMKAGLKKIPAYIREAEDENMLELALVENIQREDLDAIEVAISYQRLMEEIKLTQESLGERVGKKRATVTNYLRLLKLPADIQAGIRDKKLSMGQARALLGVEDEAVQLEAFNKTVAQDLSVRQVEALVKKLKEAPRGDEKTPTDEPDEYENLRDHLSHFFGATIDFKRSNKGSGKIVIPFKSDEDLQRIVSILDKPGT
ncbi:MAG: ParB/RepB/Spo0J family partition protein [Bacteroidales bacterium]